ncbi:hypothetical protein EPO15_08585 [bacterium]|nr:MAG: hypothetical protein EPO15_08585 [bacterium]
MPPARKPYHSLAAGALFLASTFAAAYAGRWGFLGALSVVATAGALTAAVWLGLSRPGLFSALPRPTDLTLPEAGALESSHKTPAPPSHLRKDLARLVSTPGFYWRLAVLCVCYGFAGFIAFGFSTMGSPRGAPLTPAMTAYLVSMLTYLLVCVLLAAAGVGVRLGASLPGPAE